MPITYCVYKRIAHVNSLILTTTLSCYRPGDGKESVTFPRAPNWGSLELVSECDPGLWLKVCALNPPPALMSYHLIVKMQL
jgi:hypothetical protein